METASRKKVLKELSKLAFMEPEEESKIKISEKMKALELLGKCLDMFEPAPEEGGEVKISVKVED